MSTGPNRGVNDYACNSAAENLVVMQRRARMQLWAMRELAKGPPAETLLQQLAAIPDRAA